jgi:hypothetical protein
MPNNPTFVGLGLMGAVGTGGLFAARRSSRQGYKHMSSPAVGSSVNATPDERTQAMEKMFTALRLGNTHTVGLMLAGKNDTYEVRNNVTGKVDFTASPDKITINELNPVAVQATITQFGAALALKNGSQQFVEEFTAIAKDMMAKGTLLDSKGKPLTSFTVQVGKKTFTVTKPEPVEPAVDAAEARRNAERMSPAFAKGGTAPTRSEADQARARQRLSRSYARNLTV